METILEQAHLALLRVRGVSIAYQRGAQSVELQALVGSTAIRIDAVSGVGSMRIVARDYLMLARSLQFGGEAIVPRRGDQIVETRGGATFIHEVLVLGDEPPWRWSDPHRVVMRVHTKESP